MVVKFGGFGGSAVRFVSANAVPRQRWALTLIYSAALVYVLLLPGSNDLVRGLAALVKDAGFTVGHALSFGLLALLWQWTLTAHVARRWTLLLTLFVTLTMALSTEYAQTLVEGRAADIKDVIADLLGATLALYGRCNPRFRRKSS